MSCSTPLPVYIESAPPPIPHFMKSIPRSSTYHSTSGYPRPGTPRFVEDKEKYITDHPTGPTLFKSPFMTYRVRGVYYYPDPPWVPLYIDLRQKRDPPWVPLYIDLRQKRGKLFGATKPIYDVRIVYPDYNNVFMLIYVHCNIYRPMHITQIHMPNLAKYMYNTLLN